LDVMVGYLFPDEVNVDFNVLLLRTYVRCCKRVKEAKDDLAMVQVAAEAYGAMKGKKSVLLQHDFL
jgi:hypothetical protein